MHKPRSTNRIASYGPLAALLLALPAACSGDTSSTPATAPSTPPPATRPATPPPPAVASAPSPMHFDSTHMTIKGKAFTVEIAESQDQIQRGLMYRDHMDDDHGMIFFLGTEDKWSFWMKNTRIPLDIIYLDKTGRVVDIHQRRPLDETGMGPPVPALYVIELNLGMAQKLGLQRGDTVEIPKKPV